MRRPRLIAGAAAGLIGLAYVSTLNYLEPTQVGLTWDWVTGKTELQTQAGWHVRPPWVFVTTIDTRPVRVCITSAAHAAVSCKLVQFDPAGYREFVAVEGFRFVWWANRVSFNTGYREEYRGMRDIMRGYAYSSEHYSFIKVLREY